MLEKRISVLPFRPTFNLLSSQSEEQLCIFLQIIFRNENFWKSLYLQNLKSYNLLLPFKENEVIFKEKDFFLAKLAVNYAIKMTLHGNAGFGARYDHLHQVIQATKVPSEKKYYLNPTLFIQKMRCYFIKKGASGACSIQITQFEIDFLDVVKRKKYFFLKDMQSISSAHKLFFLKALKNEIIQPTTLSSILPEENQDIKKNQILDDATVQSEALAQVREIYLLFAISKIHDKNDWFVSVKNFYKNNIFDYSIGILDFVYIYKGTASHLKKNVKNNTNQLVLKLQKCLKKYFIESESREETELKLENYKKISDICRKLKSIQIFDMKYFFIPQKDSDKKGWLRLTKEEFFFNQECVGGESQSHFIYAEIDFDSRKSQLISRVCKTKYIISLAATEYMDSTVTVIPLSEIKLRFANNNLSLIWAVSNQTIVPVHNHSYIAKNDENIFLRLIYCIGNQYQNSLELFLKQADRFSRGQRVTYKGILLLPRRQSMYFFEFMKAFETNVWPKGFETVMCFILVDQGRRYRLIKNNMWSLKLLKKIDQFQIVFIEEDWVSQNAHSVMIDGDSNFYEILGHHELQKNKILPLPFLHCNKNEPLQKSMTIKILIPSQNHFDFLFYLYENFLKENCQAANFKNFSFIRLRSDKDELRIHLFGLQRLSPLAKIDQAIASCANFFLLTGYEYSGFKYEAQFLSDHSLRLLIKIGVMQSEDMLKNINYLKLDEQNIFDYEVKNIVFFAHYLVNHCISDKYSFYKDLNEKCNKLFKEVKKDFSFVCDENFLIWESLKNNFKLIQIREQLKRHFFNFDLQEQSVFFERLIHSECLRCKNAFDSQFEILILKSLLNLNYPPHLVTRKS